MKSLFFSRTKIAKEHALANASMLSTGRELYLSHKEILDKLTQIDSIPLYDLYKKLEIPSYAPISKRNLYRKYKSGIIVGAGSGADCQDLSKKFHLIDPFEEGMINKAAGYKNSKGTVNIVSSSEGNTLTSVSDKNKVSTTQIDIITLDSLKVKECEIISVDSEGMGVDVISGAIQTITAHKPDLFISIYHNWLEYLLLIPIIYDLGYEIHCVKSSNFIPEQPHLELSLLCKYVGP